MYITKCIMGQQPAAARYLFIISSARCRQDWYIVLSFWDHEWSWDHDLIRLIQRGWDKGSLDKRVQATRIRARRSRTRKVWMRESRQEHWIIDYDAAFALECRLKEHCHPDTFNGNATDILSWVKSRHVCQNLNHIFLWFQILTKIRNKQYLVLLQIIAFIFPFHVQFNSVFYQTKISIKNTKHPADPADPRPDQVLADFHGAQII